MFIRIQDKYGIGVFRSDEFDYHDNRYSDLFEFLSGITRAPKFYSGMVEGHECLGVDPYLGNLLDEEIRFAWRYDFFLMAISGDLTPSQQEIAKEHYYLEFIDTEKKRRDFIEYLAERKISIMLIDGPPEAETEQQVMFYPYKMDYVDELLVDDHYMLSIEALESVE